MGEVGVRGVSQPEEGPEFGPTLFSHLHAGDRGEEKGGVGGGVVLWSSLWSSVSERATVAPPTPESLQPFSLQPQQTETQTFPLAAP